MDKKEIGWLIFVTIIVGAVVGNCVFIPILYLFGATMSLKLSLWCSALAAGLYLVQGAIRNKWL